MKRFEVRGSRVFAGCLIVLWWLGYGHGAAEEPPVVETKEVVISATKTEQPISQVTSAVEVITGKELEQKKIKTVVDALRLSPGLAVFSTGGPGTSATVRIRGGSSAQTLVLIDGAVMNSPTLGEFNFANLTTDNIERIEILRGAQSMLWGSDAMGGVINIITKRGRGTPTASSFVEYGSFVSIREGGSVSGQKGPVDFSMALSRWDFTGFSAVNFRRGAAERDAFRNWQASSQIGLALPKDGRLEFNFRWLNGDVNFDNGSVSGPFDVFKAKNTSNQFVFSGSYDQPITQWWSQKLTLARAEERLISQSGTFRRNVTTGVVSPVFPFPGDIQTLTNRLEWQHNFQLGKPLLLTAGYQFREGQGKNVTTTPQLDNLISSHAGFAQAQVNLWERLFFTAGLRQDSFNVFGDATTYRVTAGYLQKEIGTKVRGSYSTGFRAPTINELFFPNFGNSNLQPEKSQSFDVGVDQFFLRDRVKVSAGYFWNRFRNLIVTTFDPVACAPFSTFGFCPLNVGSAKTQGWEAGFTYAIAKDLPWIKSFELQGNYTYTLTRDLETGARLPRWPVHQWTGILSYQPVDPFLINLAYRYVGSRFSTTGNQQPLGAFNVVTLSATYDVTKRVQAYTRIENLFNEEYEEILNFGTPVRSIYGGVRIKY